MQSTDLALDEDVAAKAPYKALGPANTTRGMKKDESAPQLQYMPLGFQSSPGLGNKNSSGYKSGTLPSQDERLVTQNDSQGN